MLPFLRPKRLSATIIENRAKPKVENEDKSDSAAMALINAIHAKDPEAVEAAINQLMKPEPENEQE